MSASAKVLARLATATVEGSQERQKTSASAKVLARLATATVEGSQELPLVPNDAAGGRSPPKSRVTRSQLMSQEELDRLLAVKLQHAVDQGLPIAAIVKAKAARLPKAKAARKSKNKSKSKNKHKCNKG